MGGSARNFLQKAIAGGEREVQMSQEAATKASSNEVKQFASKMVQDHQKANEELQQLASQKGVSASAGSNKSMKGMPQGSGEAYDKAYMQQQVRMHEQSVADFEKQSRSADDPDVQQLATKLLPTLKEHLEEAKSLASKIGASSVRNP